MQSNEAAISNNNSGLESDAETQHSQNCLKTVI